jgi:deazaflavin-dependent oxidoreductase (nitroreductase family)
MLPDEFWSKIRNIQRIHRVLYAIGLGPVIGRIILLLTTTGRRSGQPRVTPLQYEQVDGRYCLGAARGLKADWVRNLQADPHVQVRVRSLRFRGTAELITDPARIADFLELRLDRHPLMVGLMMEKAHGLPRRPSRQQLEAVAAGEALVVITPEPAQGRVADI